MLNETHLLAELHHRLAVSSLQFRALLCTSISWLTGPFACVQYSTACTTLSQKRTHLVLITDLGGRLSTTYSLNEHDLKWATCQPFS